MNERREGESDFTMKYAFIDEYGDSGLDFSKPNVSTYFVVSALIFDKDDIVEQNMKADRIRNKFFHNGEMKSSKIAGNDRRRIEILNAFRELNFSIYAVAFDKRELKAPGFKYHMSFYKFLHGWVDKELFRTFRHLKIVSDEHADEKFMKGFRNYIEKSYKTDLFNTAEFEFVKSDKEALIQLSDVIVGSIGRYFEPSNKKDLAPVFMDILRLKTINIKKWPIDCKPYIHEFGEIDASFDITISELSIRLAEDFIEQRCNTKVHLVIEQINFLSFLLFYFNMIDPMKWIPSREIIKQLGIKGGFRKSENHLRAKIVSKLRDKDILIASSPNGYKLPANNSDISELRLGLS